MKKLSIIITALLFCANAVFASKTTVDTIMLPNNIILACDHFTWDINGRTYSSDGRDTVIKDTLFRNDTLYTINLNLSFTKISDESYFACDSYDWRGNHYTETQVVSDTVHKGGLLCDSIYRLNLTIKHSGIGDTVATGCDSFSWYGTSRTSSGDYIRHAQTVEGCDSTVTLHLTINHSSSSIFDTTVCDAYLWPLNNVRYATSISGVTYGLTNVYGCDSIVTLNLVVNHSDNVEDYQHGCDSFDWGGRKYSVQGSYNHTFTNRFGCDSIVTLHLSIDHGSSAIDVVSACDSYTWMDGAIYNDDNSSAQWIIPNSKGCDSTITLNLTINHSGNRMERDTVCDSKQWHGIRYTESGNYLHHYVTMEGCPSIDTLKLVVNNSNYSIVRDTACDSYTWMNGITYTESNDEASYLLVNQSGCDSTVILNLVVNHSKTKIEPIVVCDSLTWHGRYYANSVTDTFSTRTSLGCDSIVILNLTVNKNSSHLDKDTVVCDTMRWHDIRYTESGYYLHHYVTVEGCPSVDTLKLVVKQSISTILDTTVCDKFVWNGKTYTESILTDTVLEASAANYHCDSLIRLNLIINHNTSKVVYDTACEEYSWRAGDSECYVGTFNNSGLYHYEYTSTEGCPSVDSLCLTIHNNITETRWNDVITVNNKTRFGEFKTCTWYHNGEFVGSKNYCREVGGLTGSYYVVATAKNGDTIVSCTREFDNRLADKVEPVAVPNPVLHSTTITNGSWGKGEAIVVCDIQGQVVWSGITTEDGYAELNLAGLSQGLYMIKIGEDVIKIVKK